MAKQRIINTRFWSDGWVSELNPLERYLFIYLLTNEHTNICGAYELPLKLMAVETGIDKEMLPKMLKRFERDKKVFYVDSWVCVTNFAKHQSTKGAIQTGIERCLAEIPEQIQKKLNKLKEARGGLRSPEEARVIKSNSIKSNSIDIATPTDSPFFLLDELNKLKTSNQRHIQLIGEYLEEKKIQLDTKEELKAAIKRHLRSAVQLAKFSDDKIGRATKVAEEEYPAYTLDTLVKILTR